MIDDEAYDNQREYLKATKKPMNLLAKKWIKRIRVINGYLPGMADGAAKFTDSELICYWIKPNIPSLWLKDFKIGGGLVMNSTFQVIQLLQAIEDNEKFTDSELIRYCIKPNIPSSWLKDFKIGGGLVMNSTFQVIQLLQVIKENEKFTRKKSKNDKKPEKKWQKG